DHGKLPGRAQRRGGILRHDRAGGGRLMDRLPWDAARDAKRARRAGWTIDKDCWWRPYRWGDAILHNCSHFGFISADERPPIVYVRSALYARAYDSGIILHGKRFDRVRVSARRLRLAYMR